ncbi:MAG TPA: SGNH/GDSL hydrolase family protein [Pyrinomonadaceae bacterium]|jgi:lysophospholipase L1-like esterase|nr:SGNH/GDSL hydrolase family protein [Pyrinomonadaceae bacterium]
MGRKEQREGKRRIASDRWPVKLLLVLAGLAVGLLVVEIGLRIVGYSFPIFYTTDLDRGIALRAGAEGWYRREGKNYVRINSDGLRDVEHTKAKPANTLRIAVIGDSYAEAFQVPLENAFWAVMERRLEQCGKLAGKQIEVINFGVSGYGTAQELITLRRKVWDYSPDIVLLAVCTGNDITDNSRAFKKTEIPYFVYRDGEQLVLDNSFQDSRTFRLRNSALNRAGLWLRDSLRFVQAIHEAQLAIKTRLAARRAQSNTTANAATATTTAATAPSSALERSALATASDIARSEELGLDNLIYREPDEAAWKDAWRVTEGLITLMREEVKDKGAKFLVVTLSNGIQVHPDAQARRAFMQRVGATDLFYPDARLRALGERENINVLNLAPALQAYAGQHKIFLHGFDKNIGNGHWNTEGHARAGELIAQKICEDYDK